MRRRNASSEGVLMYANTIPSAGGSQHAVRESAVLAGAATVDDEGRIVRRSEAKGGGEVLRRRRRDGPDARFGFPGVEPARGLGERRLIAKPVRIPDSPEGVGAGGSIGRIPAV